MTNKYQDHNKQMIHTVVINNAMAHTRALSAAPLQAHKVLAARACPLNVWVASDIEWAVEA